MNPARFRILLVAAYLAICGVDHAIAADPELQKLKERLEEIDSQNKAIRDSYERQIQQLERRIKALEEDNERLKRIAPTSAVSPAEIETMKKQINELETITGEPSAEALEAMKRARANAEAIKKIEMQLQADATETRDIYREDGGWPFDITKFYDLPMPFEFHGYMRSGFGMNGDGGKMEAFKAPGAAAKYRLGNEADTYGELGLTHNWLRADEPLKAPYVRTTTMLSYSTTENFSYDSLNNQAQGNDIALRQAYVEAGNVFQSSPDIKFWAGQRYYRRHDIYINDFYYLDMSGYGGGIEDVPVGSFGKFALAWLGGSVDNYQTDSGNVAKQNADLRLYDIKVPGGNLTLWFDYAYTKGGEVNNVSNPNGSTLNLESAGGVAVGLIHRTPGQTLLGGYNEFSLQYGEGAAYNFQSTLDSSGPDLRDAWRFRVTDQIMIQPSKHWAMQLIGLYEKTDFGGPNSEDWWASTGVRPIYFFNDRFSLALETGMDWAKSEPLDTEGNLWKISFAPQLSRGGLFFSRPVIRVFVTYAKWTEGFKGQIGGTPYRNDTQGMSYGVQAEAWW